jgi:small-conductance mechanosensitive channel
VKKLFEQLTTPEVMAEVLALLMAALLATGLAFYLKNWLRPLATRDDLPRWPRRVVVAGMVLAPALIGLLLVVGLRALFGAFDMHTALLDIALDLTTVLVLVRFAVHVISVSLGPNSWIRAWELKITFVLWAIISFQVLGWFSGLEHTLDSIDLLPGKATFSLWSLLKGLVVIVGFLIVTSLIARTIERRVMKLEGLAISTRIGISKFSTFLLVGLGILLGVNASGVDLTVLGLFTGAIGLGLGFGLQAIASNFVSGFVLLLDKSIKPGDVISFTGTTGTSTENFGWVQELRGRYIVVRDRDGVETLVPNQNLITNSVINWSYSDQRVRIRLPVHISFHDDPEVALQVLIDAAANHPRILKDPGPVSRLMSFENYGMRVEVRFWIRDPMNGVNNVRSDVNREIWRLFKKHGITIPVQQHDVRLIQHEPDLPQDRPMDRR